MPLIHVTTTETVSTQQESLLQKLSHVGAEGMERPEAYMMVIIQERTAMMVAGAEGPAAFVDVRSIGGLSDPVCALLSERLCAVLLEELKVPGERVYLNFTEFAGTAWGNDGHTLGHWAPVPNPCGYGKLESYNKV